MVDVINNTTEISVLKAMLKAKSYAEHHPVIEARIAVLKAKPAAKEYTYTLKFNAKGGISPPMAVYLDQDGGTKGIQSLIDALEAAKTDPRLKPYSK